MVRFSPLLLLTLGACARYTPAPLDLDAAPAAYRARSLSDPALLAALDSIGVPAAERWNEWSLAHAAWLMRPERARLLAEVRAAEAAVVSAGGRPAPGVAGGVEGTFSGKDGTSPWAVSLSGLFRFELGGKRGARIARAEAGVLAARLRLVQEGWDFRTRTRRGMQDVSVAARLYGSTEELVLLADLVVAHYQRRYDEGVLGAAELARLRADRDAIRAEQVAARNEVTEAEARLRLQAGLVEWRTVMEERRGYRWGCDGVTLAARDSLARLALTSRVELAVVLAEYQESEGDVRLAAAASWPDLELGPGLLYDHGAGKWTIGFGLPAIPTGYRGPLREAMARREVQAARVAEVQAAVLADVDAAIGRCEAAGAGLAELQPLAGAAADRLRDAEAARDRGETGEAPVALARLELLRWRRAVDEAYFRRGSAGLDLDQAVGVWNRGTNTTTEAAGD